MIRIPTKTEIIPVYFDKSDQVTIIELGEEIGIMPNGMDTQTRYQLWMEEKAKLRANRDKIEASLGQAERVLRLLSAQLKMEDF